MLTVSNRPRLKAIPEIIKSHDLVVTLLTHKEGATEVGSTVKYHGGVWVHYSLSCKRNEGMNNLVGLVWKLSDLIKEGRKPFIHCAAGRDRSGIILAALLHGNGLTRAETEAVIRRLRPTILESKWLEVGFTTGSDLRKARVRLGLAPYDPAFRAKLLKL